MTRVAQKAGPANMFPQKYKLTTVQDTRTRHKYKSNTNKQYDNK